MARHFFRQGNDPKSTRGINGKYLLEEVHAVSELAEAQALYDSPMWALVARDAPSAIELEQHEKSLKKRLNLGSFSPLQAAVAREVAFEHPGVSTDLESLGRHADAVARVGSVDAMALLGCRFRLAMERFSLLEANVYLESLKLAIARFHSRWCCIGEVSGSLRILLEARLLRRTVDGDWRRLLGFPRYCSHPDLSASFHWSKSTQILSIINPEVEPPLVPLDDHFYRFLQDFPSHQVQARDSILAKTTGHLAIHGQLDENVDGCTLESLRLLANAAAGLTESD